MVYDKGGCTFALKNRKMTTRKLLFQTNKKNNMKNNTVYLEHINITVEDIDKSILFFQTAFPQFRIRVADGEGAERWVHLGTDDTYIAIQQNGKPMNRPKDYSRNGINHLGFVVADVKAVAQRLLEAGYQKSYPMKEEKYRIRDYFVDHEGYEYEFVEYLSDKVEERNFND